MNFLDWWMNELMDKWMTDAGIRQQSNHPSIQKSVFIRVHP
jgi:hypothetical protein